MEFLPITEVMEVSIGERAGFYDNNGCRADLAVTRACKICSCCFHRRLTEELVYENFEEQKSWLLLRELMLCCLNKLLSQVAQSPSQNGYSDKGKWDIVAFIVMPLHACFQFDVFLL